MNFSEFGFDPDLMEGISAMGFETPTPIQEQAIPAILDGKDIIGSDRDRKDSRFPAARYSEYHLLQGGKQNQGPGDCTHP